MIRPATRRTAAAALVITLLLALSACGINRQGSDMSESKAAKRDRQFAEAMTHPDIEEITQRYGEMIAALRDRLVSELNINPWWEDPEGRGSAGCREYPEVESEDKESRHLSIWVSDGNLPDDKWSRAVQIFAEVTAAQGFETPPRVIVDRPGDHQITVADKYGADAIFGTKLNTTLRARTGCHLKAEAKKRGTPSVREYGR